MDLQIAVGSAGPQQGAPDCSGQRRASTASPRLQWASPDLTRGALARTGQRWTSPGSSRAEWAAPGAGPQLPEDMSDDMSEEMSEKNVRRNVRRYVNRNAR